MNEHQLLLSLDALLTGAGCDMQPVNLYDFPICKGMYWFFCVMQASLQIPLCLDCNISKLAQTETLRRVSHAFLNAGPLKPYMEGMPCLAFTLSWRP